jgi:hypothetical protein
MPPKKTVTKRRIGRGQAQDIVNQMGHDFNSIMNVVKQIDIRKTVLPLMNAYADRARGSGRKRVRRTMHRA